VPPPDRPIDHADELSIEAPGAREEQVVPWPLLLRQRVLDRVADSERYPWIVLITVLFGLFSVGFTITILSTSIPRIAGDLHTSESTLTWVLTGPLLAFAVFGPAAGKLGDLKGHRRVYLASVACVSVFAGLTAIAPNAGALILFRILGAATGAATGPTSLALINRLFPPDRRAPAMGYWSMVGAGGPVIGVVAGGPIVETFGWRWIFAAQVPLTLATLVLAAFVLPDTPRIRGSRFDLPGATTLGLGATALLLAINRGPVVGWDHPAVLGGFVLAPALLVAFVRIERRSTHPLLPLRYLRQRNFSAPLSTNFFMNFAYMGGFVLTPLLLQNEFGYAETRTGLLMIARPLTFAIAGPVAGYMTLRIGTRTSAVFGAACIGASMIGLAAVAPGTTDATIIGVLALSGLGMGAASPAMATAIANAVDPDDLGIAGATQQMVNQIGASIGIQVMQTVHAGRAASVGEIAAYGDAYLIGAAACLLGVLTALFVRANADPAASSSDDRAERRRIQHEDAVTIR
jgi:EmrB/QacA subfamily drug resistance transporter